MRRKNILLIDDNKVFCNLTKSLLEKNNYNVIVAYNKNKAIEIINNNSVDLVLLDLNLPNTDDGMEVLTYSLEKKPDLTVIMISGERNISLAIKAVKKGADDFIEKPFDDSRLLLTIHNALEKRELEIKYAKAESRMIGNSEAMQRVYERVYKIAKSDNSVLITGESGTGKELIARAIHNLSKRASKEMGIINSAAIAKDLIENELFGSIRGAYTDATDRKGIFEHYNHSTIFLDEIGDMSLSAQSKLLRVLEYGELQRVGGSHTIKVDVRSITATNKNLETEVKNGNFRRDLYYRLRQLTINIPPLRERKEDIPLLANYFLQRACRKERKQYKYFTADAISLLFEYDWPGNIRELKNTIEASLVFCEKQKISAEDIELPSVSNNTHNNLTLREATERFQKNYIMRKLAENNWNVSKTADSLGIETSNLFKKMKRLGIPTKEKI